LCGSKMEAIKKCIAGTGSLELSQSASDKFMQKYLDQINEALEL